VTPSTRSRQPRKDAQLNRAHILDVAGHAFVNDGVDVSMDAIAKQAGIGNATLYRHFPTKDALLVALLTPHHEQLEQEKAAIEQGGGHAGLMLEQWIDALGDWMLAYDGLPEPLRAAWSVTGSPLKSTCDGLIESTDVFLRAAQCEGFARPSLSAQDIFLGALAVAWASRRSTARPDTRRGLRDVLRNGWSAVKGGMEEQAGGVSGTANMNRTVARRKRSNSSDR
jgi:AcrR family transcriptional regulator